MAKKKALTIEQHRTNGILLTTVRDGLIKSFVLTNKMSLAESEKVSRELNKALAALDAAQSKLDSIYHRQITDDEFQLHGHLYYGRSYSLIDVKLL